MLRELFVCYSILLGLPLASASQDESDALFDPLTILEVDISMDPTDWDFVRMQQRPSDPNWAAATCLAQPWQKPFSWREANVTIKGQTALQPALPIVYLSGKNERQRLVTEVGREGKGGAQGYTKKLFAGRLNRLFIEWGVLKSDSKDSWDSWDSEDQQESWVL